MLTNSNFRLILSICLLLATASTSSVCAQQSEPEPTYAPSPMSKYSAPVLQAKNRPVLLSDATLDQLETHDIDLSEALAGYARVHECSLYQAFKTASSFLNMVPLSESKTNASSAQALYQIKEKDIYRITATRRFFNSLPESIDWIEQGLQNVVFEIRYISVEPKDVVSIQKFALTGTFKMFANQLPQIDPVATQAKMKPQNDGQIQRDEISEPSGTFVSSSLTKSKSFPTFLAKLDAKGMDSLVQTAKGTVDMNLSQAPTLTTYLGQVASISDAAARPFVIGVTRKEGDFSVAHQPIIQTIEDGTVFRLKADREQGKIRVSGDMAFSQIESVETFEFEDVAKNGKVQQIAVQVPEQSIKQVHWSTTIESGNTILIDPVFIQKETRYEKKGFQKKKIEISKRMLVLITPRLVDAHDQEVKILGSPTTESRPDGK